MDKIYFMISIVGTIRHVNCLNSDRKSDDEYNYKLILPKDNSIEKYHSTRCNGCNKLVPKEIMLLYYLG